MFDFNVKLMGNMSVTVIADNKEEAQRILNDTIDSITVRDIKEKLTNRDDVEIKSSNVITEMNEKNKDRGIER